jgi:hypothetical protein
VAFTFIKAAHSRCRQLPGVRAGRPGGKKPGVLVVKIEGGGFATNLRSFPRKVRVNVTSRSEAFLTIPNPNQTEVVTLTDPATNISVSTVVARKPPNE